MGQEVWGADPQELNVPLTKPETLAGKDHRLGATFGGSKQDSEWVEQEVSGRLALSHAQELF